MKPGFLLSALLVFAAAAADAQQAVSPEAWARAQSLLQQAGREKAALDAENAQLLAERARLVREVERLAQAADAATREDAQAARVRSALESRLAESSRTNAGLKTDLSEARRKIATLEHELATRETSAEKLTAALTAQTRRTNDVTEKNRALVALAEQLMELSMDGLARKRGALTAWLAREPVTGLAEVDVENALQAARTRLFELGVNPGLE